MKKEQQKKDSTPCSIAIYNDKYLMLETPSMLVSDLPHGVKEVTPSIMPERGLAGLPVFRRNSKSSITGEELS